MTTNQGQTMTDRKGTSADFTQTLDAWERSVFMEATHFTVALFRGRGRYDHQEYKDFNEALTAVEQPSNNGRPRLLYAVTREGRSVCLDRADRPAWLELWQTKQEGD
jgi:hypothetical protein